jgi:hypothetical protein
MRRLRAAVVPIVFLFVAAPAFAAPSHAIFWRALGNDLNCGVAIATPGKAAAQLLCSGTGIPNPPKGVGFGDGGFVFLSAHGNPKLARLSQDTFANSNHPVGLSAHSTWSELGVTCRIGPTSVRCTNESGHGFSIGKRVSAYKSF